MTPVIPLAAAERLGVEAARHPYPLVFATVSGAHLSGFPSPDSNFDLRGAHVLPARRWSASSPAVIRSSWRPRTTNWNGPGHPRRA